jgi:hypothetical protein
MEKQNDQKEQSETSATCVASPPLSDLLNDWPSFDWPDWVPEKVRQQIADFWDEKCGRSPKHWIENTVNGPYTGHPPMGTRVRCESIGGGERFEGRWIPAWNNIGRVVLDDGTVEVSSTCALEVI